MNLRMIAVLLCLGGLAHAESKAPAKPVEPLPVKVEEVDSLRTERDMERKGRLEAQIAALRTEEAKVQADLQKDVELFRARYKLDLMAGDDWNRTTREIVRAKVQAKR